MGCAASKLDNASGSRGANLGAPPPSQSQTFFESMEEEVCEFYFIDADFLRSRQDTKPLPNFQKLQVESPAAFKRERYSMTQVVTGFHTKEDLIISHRWFQSECPDPDGMQLAAIKNFLKEHKYIERVWFDEWCMPQEATQFNLFVRLILS